MRVAVPTQPSRCEAVPSEGGRPQSRTPQRLRTMCCSDHREQRSSPGHAARKRRALPATPGKEVNRPLCIRGRPGSHLPPTHRGYAAATPALAGSLVLGRRHVGAGHCTKKRGAELVKNW